MGRGFEAEPDPSTFAGLVAVNIRRLRDRTGKSVAECAAESDISVAAWYRIERGDTTRTTAIHFMDLAKFFNCKPAELVKEPKV